MTPEEWRQLTTDLMKEYVKAPGAPPTQRLAFGIGARSELEAQNLAAELARTGCSDFQFSKSWWPFGKRWELIALSAPVRFQEDDVQSWVQSTIRLARDRNAKFKGWAPTGRAA